MSTVSALSPTELTCEYATDPIGIDCASPRFGWVLEAERRGQMQTAYRILVASSAHVLAAGEGDRWDSGRVASDRSVNVPYDGPSLASRERCFWSVQVFDGDGVASAPSSPATFRMGLLGPGDWTGSWIDAPEELAAPLLRRTFDLDTPVASAQLHLAALGLYEGYLNGARLDDRVLDPALSDYRVRVPYVSYEVGDRLQAGRNVLAFMLGNGWYRGRSDGKYRFSSRLQLLLQLDITHTDGSTSSVVSDGAWRAIASPVQQNSFHEGETYDARLDREGWADVGHDDGDWATVEVGDGPTGMLFSQQMPPMRVIERRPPEQMSTPRPATTVFDFGQLFGGWVRIRLAGERGTEVSIEHSARILSDGVIDDVVYPGKQECDTYILRGDASGEWYEPRFTFHPVRYVQVTGDIEQMALADIAGCVVHTDVDLTAEFECSDPLLNQIHSNVTWSMRNAMKGFPMDCLHREPLGYNEPASVSSILFTRTHMPHFWTKWAGDIRVAQGDNGWLSDWAPELPGSGREHDAAQAGNFAAMLWYLYHYYDDERLLADNYPAIRRWVDYLGTVARDYLVEVGWLGDHMLPGPAPGYEEYVAAETPPPLLWTGYYYLGARVVADAARILGHGADADRYAQLTERIDAAYNTAFFDEQTGNYAGGSQTANSFSLLIGLCPPERQAALVANIRREVMDTHDGHIHTGHVGTTSLIEALTRYGDGETLLSVAAATGYPGWGYMVEQGATTIWESWGHDWAPDHDRAVQRAVSHRADSMMMWGCIDRFFFAGLAGIGEPPFHGTGSPPRGFRHVEIRPLVVGELSHARARIRTVRGTVASSWRRDASSMELTVEVPANSTATVAIPKLGWQQVAVAEGGTPCFAEGRLAAAVEGVSGGEEAADCVELQVGSGRYRFVLRSAS